MGAVTVAVASSGSTNKRAMWSTDEVTWNAIAGGMPTLANGSASFWVDVAYSPVLDQFCAISNWQGNNNNGIAISNDHGATWTGVSNGPTGSGNSLNGICWSVEKGIYVAVGNANIWTSPDGSAWTSQSVPEANNWLDVCWSPSLGLFCAVAGSGTHQVMTSPDGVTWTVRTHAISGCNSICWDGVGARFLSIGATSGHIQSSTNGTSWTDNDAHAGISTFTYYDIFANPTGEIVVCGGNGGEIGHSTGSVTTFTGYTGIGGYGSGFNNVMWSVKNSLWVVTGNGGQLFTSPDGASWTGQSVPALGWLAACEGIPPINIASVCVMW